MSTAVLFTTTNGLPFLVSEEDKEFVASQPWTALKVKGSSNYIMTLPRPRLMLHRLLLNAPEGIRVDHINGHPEDNRRSNLRLATDAQNARNRRKHSTMNGKPPVSQYKGVFQNCNNWKACIRVNRKNMYLGTYRMELEAALAYDDAALRHFGEFAKFNFPDGPPPDFIPEGRLVYNNSEAARLRNLAKEAA